MNYNREFINLIQVDLKYAQKNKEIIGRCKIETKDNSGQINIWVQNLLPNNIFDIYLISHDKDKFKAIKINNLKTDKSGYGELNFNFDTNNILDSNLKISDINIIAMTPGNNKQIIITEGYKNQKIDWHDNFKEINIKPDSKDNKAENKLENKILDNKNDINKKDDKNKNQEIKADLEKNKKNIDLDHEQEKKCDDKKNIEAKENKEPEKNIKDISYIFMNQEKIKTYEYEGEKINLDLVMPKDNKYKKTDDIKYIFDKNIRMSPFEKQNKKINWVRLSLKELACFEINYWTLVNHPFVFYAYKKNKHLILGQDNNKNNNYIIGLPDRYQPEYKNSMRKLGFTQFKTCKNKNITRNDYGYWLMPVYF